ncbi:hypothetical protein CCACVL1_23889 [Corchorus capsularis]|uniref:Uncharacterized protein n=1 Tax=Corchorus capsularis TaxID=210143 RepID=A0A1R3GRM5_COCAP|nr:hypothetical protein CCACVL1_23889 [Corchorus capsularis]
MANQFAQGGNMLQTIRKRA